jgi:hypothetical protein
MKKLLNYVKKRLQLPWHIPLHPTVRRYDAWFRDWRFYDRFLPSMFLLGVLVFLVYYLTFAR